MSKIVTLIFLFLSPYTILAQVSVLTQHNDLARTGENLSETHLNVSNVVPGTFGKIFSREVDDQIYAQPLIVSRVNFLNSIGKNVVFVATVNNSVYAFDADDAAMDTAYWHKNFTPAGTHVVKNTDMTGACGGFYQDFSGHIGIVATPVIDTVSKTMYFVSRDKVTTSGVFEQWLHAIDFATGEEKSFSPVLITAKYYGNGDGSVNDTIIFDAQKENQRSALALVNGVIWLAWSSHCDWNPYHGWVIGYDASNFQQKYIWMDTPDGYQAGIWMSGQALSADEDGNLYLSTGNGSVGYNGDDADTINRGESFLKLQPFGSSLHVASFFTPHNYDFLENYDLDLGSEGLLLIPNTHYAISGGKEGMVYLVNRDTMGGVDTVDHVIEEFSEGGGNELHSGPVFWHNDTADYVYIWAASQYMHAYRLRNNPQQPLDLPAAMTSPESSSQGQPGGMMSVSANGSELGTGILWAALPLSGDANQQTRPGILRAYDADDLSNELWNSQINPELDSVGAFAKFVCPTIANGKVYLATFSGELVVYGLLNPQGINEIAGEEKNWSVYPDPASEQITIEGSLAQSSSQKISITDITGREWYRVHETNSAVKFHAIVNVHSWPAGIYFVKMNGDVKTFVKQ
ncbi:MAG: T9SS type A sorting domain-containing protein [Chitinophagales bacterium]